MTKQELEKNALLRLRNTGTLETFIAVLGAKLEPTKEMFANYRCAAMEVETKFRVLDEQFSVENDTNPIQNIRTRIKSYDSIMRKLVRKGYPYTLESIQENMYDIAGVRVVCTFEDDIYRLANVLLMQDDIELVEKRDYIREPKESGYRSLHLIIDVPIFREDGRKMVKVEVQLRTAAMDFWANMEHKLQYNKDISPEIALQVEEELRECAKISADLDRRIQNVRDIIDSNESNPPGKRWRIIK